MASAFDKPHANKIKKWNLENKKLRLTSMDKDILRETMINRIYAENVDIQADVQAITVCFSDIEGRLQMLDYDKSFLIRNYNNLTFDGSSIRGFTEQNESDLKLELDWGACYQLVPEIFGDKLYMFAKIKDKDGSSYSSDIRTMLANKLAQLQRDRNIEVNVAAEIEGFLFQGIDVEKSFRTCSGFVPITMGGYFNTLPQSPLRQFIDTVAAVQRSAGFENEKDHPEVAPAQFEINWSYTEALIAADQIQLYKMICRQVANLMGYTASFLPKPMVGINGSGMHTNISLKKNNTNLFYDHGQKCHLSSMAWDFIENILNRAKQICLCLNSSVNAYRRLDPDYEAPNEIKASSVDRGAMIRVPIGNKRSARIEVRSVSPDANPYLVILSILEAGLNKEPLNSSSGFLPSDISEAIGYFRNSELMQDMLGAETHDKYLKWKQKVADRCPRKLGKSIKRNEIIYHHEVTNQQLWSKF